MKKLLLLSLSVLLLSSVAGAQSFTTASGSNDTVTATVGSGTTSFELHNNITSASSTPLRLKWKVIGVSFDAGWSTGLTGVCDNYQCYNDVNLLLSGASKISDPYNTAAGTFDVTYSLNNPAPNSKAVVTVRVTDTVTNYARILTFIAYRSSGVGVGQVTATDGISLYPNPAHESVNVLFSKDANIKTIEIFNLIGKTVRVFKPTDNSSAKLDLDEIPSGVYFVRLINAQGDIIAIRRFIRQ